MLLTHGDKSLDADYLTIRLANEARIRPENRVTRRSHKMKGKQERLTACAIDHPWTDFPSPNIHLCRPANRPTLRQPRGVRSLIPTLAVVSCGGSSFNTSERG